MQVQEVLPVIMKVLETASEVLGALVILSTIVVRMTASKKDDAAVLKVSSSIWSAIAWLPTLGVNPQTKALKAAYEEQKSKLDQIQQTVAEELKKEPA
jgi:hypothetical protein